MSLEIWLAFVITSSVILVIPGPTILTVVSYALKHGQASTTPLVLAVALGDATAVTLSLIGLGSLLATSATLFVLIKTLGGLYLIYLGIRFLIEKPALESRSYANREADALFFNTFMVTALNPKGIIFFVAFLPQFVNHEHSVVPQLAILASTFVILGAINAGIYALLANRISPRLNRQRTQMKLKKIGGTLLCVAGLWTLSSEKI